MRAPLDLHVPAPTFPSRRLSVPLAAAHEIAEGYVSLVEIEDRHRAGAPARLLVAAVVHHDVRSARAGEQHAMGGGVGDRLRRIARIVHQSAAQADRKSTRLNYSH